MADVGCVSGAIENASLSKGDIAVKNITTDGAGAGSVAHGITNAKGEGVAPRVAFAIPLSGDDYSAMTVSVTSANIVIAGGGNTKKHVVVAIR